MRYLPALATLSLILGVLAACSATQNKTVYAHGSEDDIRLQIERNWNVDFNAAEACGEPVDLRILLAPDGSGNVTGVEILPGMPDTAACTSFAQSARRAVLRASPLQLPADAKFSSLKMHFDPDWANN